MCGHHNMRNCSKGLQHWGGWEPLLQVSVRPLNPWVLLKWNFVFFNQALTVSYRNPPCSVTTSPLTLSFQLLCISVGQCLPWDKLTRSLSEGAVLRMHSKVIWSSQTFTFKEMASNFCPHRKETVNILWVCIKNNDTLNLYFENPKTEPKHAWEVLGTTTQDSLEKHPPSYSVFYNET